MPPHTALVIPIALACVASNVLGQDYAAVFDEASPAVAVVKTMDEAGSPLAEGSAFLIEPSVAVTNHHVVEGASTVVLRFQDGSEVVASGVLGADPAHDIVLLRLEADGPHVLKLAENLPRIGSRVAAIGAPRGLDFTISDGIVSAHRELDAAANLGILIQFTAAISPGSSGGPLLDGTGTVVGVTTLLHAGANDVGFAVPAHHLQEIVRHDEVRGFPGKVGLVQIQQELSAILQGIWVGQTMVEEPEVDEFTGDESLRVKLHLADHEQGGTELVVHFKKYSSGICVAVMMLTDFRLVRAFDVGSFGVVQDSTLYAIADGHRLQHRTDDLIYYRHEPLSSVQGRWLIHLFAGWGAEAPDLRRLAEAKTTRLRFDSVEFQLDEVDKAALAAGLKWFERKEPVNGPDASLAGVAEVDEPAWMSGFLPDEDVLAQLTPSARQFVVAHTLYYALMPDGRCAHVFRAVASRHPPSDVIGEALAEVPRSGNEFVGDLPPHYGVLPDGTPVKIDRSRLLTARGWVQMTRVRPSPEQLAFAIKEGRARLIEYKVQREKLPDPNPDGQWRRSALGPNHRYRWSRVEHDLRFDESGSQTPAEATTPSAPRLQPTHSLKLKDGREFHVVVVSDHGPSLTVDVVVGGVVSRFDFKRSDVAALAELPE